MNKTVIMLAGGLSTRFQDLGDKPKCLLQLYEKPILHRLINFFQKLDYSVIISLGHLSEEVISYKKRADLYFTHKIESVPLGTGGAIRYASEGIASDNFVVLNADTINNYSMVEDALRYHVKNDLKITQIVTMQSNQNQGTIQVSDDKVIGNYEYEENFEESRNAGNFYSSTGIYVINKLFFDKSIRKYASKQEVSLEKLLIKELTKEKLVNAFKIGSNIFDLGTVDRYKSFIKKYDKESFEKQFLL